MHVASKILRRDFVDNKTKDFLKVKRFLSKLMLHLVGITKFVSVFIEQNQINHTRKYIVHAVFLAFTNLSQTGSQSFCF